MDRINKFLEKRPKKDQRILKYNKKAYKITKEDLKMVRNYKKGMNLTGTKLQPVKIRFDNFPVIEEKKRKYNEEYFRKRFLDKNRNKFEEKNKREFKEEIYDIYQNELLTDYKQEWVYDITAQYENSIENLKTEDAHEIEKLIKKFRKPVEKSIAVDQIVKMKSLNYEFLPAKNYKFSITDKLGYFVKTSDGRIIDINYGCEVDLHLSVFDSTRFHYTISKNALFYKNKQILSFEEKIKGLDANNKLLSIVFKNRIEVYKFEESLKLVNIFKFKGETLDKAKVVGSSIFVGGSNGITECSLESPRAFTSLNVVIDFDVAGTDVIAINNLNRLLCVQNNQSFYIMTGEIGKVVKAHKKEEETLIAVLFARTVKIYTIRNNKKEILPCCIIKGEYRNIEWDEKFPWLYLSNGEKTIMYT
ncbi:hypothetical protein NUSPORA_00690 [Nucleospora cyclopteri]